MQRASLPFRIYPHLFVVLFAMSLAAMTAPSQAQSSSAIAGFVANGSNGARLSGVTVELMGTGTLIVSKVGTDVLVASTTTGPDGSFSFNGLAAGSYTLTASRSGYFTTRKSIDLNGNEMSVIVSLKPTTGL